MNTSVTLFSLAKPFVGLYEIIQRNAIRSWLALGSSIEIILFGDEPGTAEVARDLGVRHVPIIERNEYGTPILGSVFRQGQLLASNDLVGFINTDIILFQSFLDALVLLPTRAFVMVGQRFDLDLAELLDFSEPSWQESLRWRVQEKGRLHEASGSDYFIFPKGQWLDFPPFLVGIPMWDNWLIFDARRKGIPVVDASRIVLVVHQKHPIPLRASGTSRELGPEAERNRALAGKATDGRYTLEDATHLLGPRGVRYAIGPRYIKRRLWWLFWLPLTTRLKHCSWLYELYKRVLKKSPIDRVL